jgi:hypothetical protein
VVDRVGEPDPAHVEHDQPPILREAAEEPFGPRVLPVQLEVADPVEHEHDVHRAGADDLVRDLEVTALRVPDLPPHGTGV